MSNKKADNSGWANISGKKTKENRSDSVAVQGDGLQGRSTKHDKELSCSEGQTGTVTEGNAAAGRHKAKQQLHR